MPAHFCRIRFVINVLGHLTLTMYFVLQCYLHTHTDKATWLMSRLFGAGPLAVFKSVLLPMLLHNLIFVLADLCLCGSLSWRVGTCVHCYCYFYRSLTLVFIVVLHNCLFILLIIFCIIISAAPIKRCQKLGTYITTTYVSFCGEYSGRFCIYKFQNLPESLGNTFKLSSGRDNQYKLQVLFANPYIFQFFIYTSHHVNLC